VFEDAAVASAAGLTEADLLLTSARSLSGTGNVLKNGEYFSDSPRIFAASLSAVFPTPGLNAGRTPAFCPETGGAVGDAFLDFA